MFIKYIALIPVFIALIFIAIYFSIVITINSFIVLFTGKYWRHAYDFNLGAMKYGLKIELYLWGLSDKYPGFNFQISDPNVSLNIKYPESPSRFFAIPVFGGLVRFILILPFLIYVYIIQQVATWTVFYLAWFWVLFKGRYPEWIYELTRDSARLQLSVQSYMTGLEERYPSFWISLNHKVPKLIVIGIMVLLSVWSIVDGMSRGYKNPNYSSSYQNNSEQIENIDEYLPQEIFENTQTN